VTVFSEKTASESQTPLASFCRGSAVQQALF